MSERVTESRDSLRLYLLTAFLSTLAGVVLFLQDWTFPVSVQPQYWNGLVAFSVLAVLCDSSFLPISRITSANVRSSVYASRGCWRSGLQGSGWCEWASGFSV